MDQINTVYGLGKVTLGTMRFFDKSLSIPEVIKIIEKAYDIGVHSHHSSYEYSSYNLYTEALNQTTCKKNIKHIVKLSSPHFEESSFSSETLEKKIDLELKKMKIEQIDVLQWLVRSKPINDRDRLLTLEQQNSAIDYCLLNLKQKGKIKSVFSFPYSVNFANEVVKLEQVDGIISYLNKEEVEYSGFANDIPFIAIRPFFAGKLLQESKNINETVADCLNFINKHKSVLSTIVGINSVKQLNAFKHAQIG